MAIADFLLSYLRLAEVSGSHNAGGLNSAFYPVLD
jgi:hypothetical protein